MEVSVSRHEPDNPDWLHAPARDLIDALERDLSTALIPVAFEPNTPPTWTSVHQTAGSYLTEQWQRGALVGSSPDEARFVQIGSGITMTQADIEEGRLILKVGFAPIRPREFLTMQFTLQMKT
ncbi:phage tail sheath C-terminal domain-containing protein [Streptomyces griseofuscus]|uniref:phage tail sheath C-terminal domain-containing protein n=1 Tax=Streptomyces griseofuscus TaxID=146922 RepID=UPI0036A0ECAD